MQYIPKTSLFSLKSTRNVQELRQEPGEELTRELGDVQTVVQKEGTYANYLISSMRSVEL